MKIDELEMYLQRADVPLDQKIRTLIESGFSTNYFLALAEDLIERVSPEEAYRHKESVMRLARLLEARKKQLGS